jgi:hypothetical protein
LILVECNPDAFLIRRLGFSRKKIKHEGGKGKVFEIVGKTGSSIGMIDEDPESGQPKEIENYRVKDQIGSLKLMVNKTDDSKRVIQVSPYLEHWIVELARKNRISLKEYHLPEDPKALHDIPHVEDNLEFMNLIEAIIRMDDDMKRVRDWIKSIEQ